MSKINRNKKFMSTLLIGTSATSLAASNTANTSSAQISGLFSSIGKKVFDMAKPCGDFIKSNILKPLLDSPAKIIKAPWSAYKWVTFDMVPKAFSPTVGLSGEINPLEILVGPFLGLSAAALWLAIQAAMVSVIGGSIYLFYRSIGYKKLKNKISELKKEYRNEEYIFHVDDLLTKEDETFLNGIKEKYGEGYSKKLEKEYREKILEASLKYIENRQKELESCETYFKSIFVVNNPENENFFEKNKDNPEKDYGLIGPNKLSPDDLNFIKEKLPEMKEEIDFLKKKRKFESDKELISDFRQSLVNYYHLYNTKAGQGAKTEDLKEKKTNVYHARYFFEHIYMNGIDNLESVVGKGDYFQYLGNDKSVEENFYNAEQYYGLLSLKYAQEEKVKNSIESGSLNFVKQDEKALADKILWSNINEDVKEKVRESFKEYVLYLHKCNKNQLEEATKDFKTFSSTKKVDLEEILKKIQSNT